MNKLFIILATLMVTLFVAYQAEALENDIVIHYGNPDGSPIDAVVGERLEIDVYIQTDDGILIDYIAFALGLEDQYFDSLLSYYEGQVYDVMLLWQVIEFNLPAGSPPNPAGWSAESFFQRRNSGSKLRAYRNIGETKNLNSPEEL